MTTKRRTGGGKRGGAAKPKARAARGGDLQERAFQLFAEQADSLWSRLIEQCRQFAYGFNQAVGGPALQVQAEPTTLRVAYPPGDAELFLQLDKDERFVRAWLNTGSTTCRDCLAEPLPVGLTVKGDLLQFALRGASASDEQLAVTLLTELTSGNAEPSGP